METGNTDGHKHHVRDLAVFDCLRCPECDRLFYGAGDEPPEECADCGAGLEDVRLDCQPRIQGFDI